MIKSAGLSMIFLFCLTANTYYQMDIDKNFLFGKFDPSQRADFVHVGAPYTFKSNVWLHKETFEAFKLMYDQAKADGIELRIISGFRSFDQQKFIWESKWNGNRTSSGIQANTISDPMLRAQHIMLYSAMPGTSRHHWGTDIDINSVSLAYFRTEKGKREYDWLLKNAKKFGFCQPYRGKGIERTGGHEDEPWHWSYVPLASKYCRMYLRLVENKDLHGFSGAYVATTIDVIHNYVMAVHPDCQCMKE